MPSLQDDESLDETTDRGELNTSSDATESITVEEYERDGETEALPAQKSLPHKKRIPNKLKKALTVVPTRSIHAKCYKCTKCGEQFPTQSSLNVRVHRNYLFCMPC